MIHRDSNGHPRLAPRPLNRPPVHPAEAMAFAPSAAGGRPEFVDSRTLPPDIPEPVAEAFAPTAPPGSEDSSGLSRPPAAPAPTPAVEPADPWRDPEAAVTLSGSGAGRPLAPAEPDDLSPAPRYTLREALFQRRLRPGALLGLLVVCLVIGAGGAFAGVLLGRSTSNSATDPTVTLAQVSPAVQRAPGSVAELAKRVLPSVVSIEVVAGQTGDTGSGVIIDARGDVLTNNHVISLAASDSSARVTVTVDDGSSTRVPATIVGRDPESDLAVLKIAVSHATVAQLGNSDTLQVGDPVIAIGSPLGLAGTVTTGIISATQRPLRLQGSETDTNAVIDALQTDAAVNPGNSGGPLIDGTGAVVGINTAIRTLSTDSESGSIGLGFAIPINRARQIAQELIRTGKVVHPTIGLNTRSATDGTTDGAAVQNVVDGGPAAKAGIQEQDIITKIGDRTVGNADDLAVAVAEHNVGDTVPVELTRDGKQLTVQVTLTAEKS